MVGISDDKEAELLDSSALFGQNLYLRLIQWTGAVGGGAGSTVNDNGTFPANVSEVSTGGYAPVQCLATNWAAATKGAPTEKKYPKLGGPTHTFTPTGGVTWNLCGYAWTTNTNAITSANLVSSGVMVDQNALATIRAVNAANPFVVSPVSQLIERLGDPPAGVNPT